MRGLARFFWGCATVVAVLWPSRLLSPLDGIPLDGRLEALAIGLALPILWWLHPTFLQVAWTRGLVSCLLMWKLATMFALTQEGWCVKFFQEASSVEESSRVQRSWDLRAGWGQPVPRCSAIMARPYATLEEFPVWFVNLLDEAGRPPHGTFIMELDGYLTTPARGSLSFSLSEGVRLQGFAEAVSIGASGPGSSEVSLGPGVHRIQIRGILTGASWRVVPSWDGRDVWRSVLTTVDAPSRLDKSLWRPGKLVAFFLTSLLIMSWAVSAFIDLGPNPAVVIWMFVMSVAMAGIAWLGKHEHFAIVFLFLCLFVPVARHLQNLRGALLLLGTPWLSFIVGRHFTQVGKITLYSLGDDWLIFQGFAHRIFLEGYWLEGGEKTFWFQPLYRWIAGSLHVVFGDSSVGEAFWDSACLLIGTLFCFHVVRAFAGFRWGLFAGAAVLATFALGPIWGLIGRGLSEVSASGWAYLGAMHLLRGRLGRLSSCLAAAVFATLAFYTRLNHLPFVATLAVLSLPVRFPARGWLPFRSLVQRLSPTLLLVFFAGITFGVALFAIRTWYYTGVFDVFYGTQRESLSTGLTASTILSPAAWGRAIESVWMVSAVADPPRLNRLGFLVTAGVVIAGLALLRVPFFRNLPLGPSALCIGALVPSLFVRGTAYPSRFSVHLVPVAIAMSVCAMALSARELICKFRCTGNASCTDPAAGRA